MDIKTNAHILGESLAKLYFELNGYFVYTNSSGKAEFDMLLSKDFKLFSVEVKTCSVLKKNTKGEFFEVQLGKVRSNKTENVITKLSNNNLDYLVIVDLVHTKIKVIPAGEVTSGRSLRVYKEEFGALI